MAYTELIKNFNNIREYMREFYVYGFKSREEFNNKSSRSYDNEKRRIDSYLGEYMSFNQTNTGKNVFMSIDSRRENHNPLFKAFKAKSFTDKDITLHFIIFDIFYNEEVKLTLSSIMEVIYAQYLSDFDEPMDIDESTIRKKLKEYNELGLINKKKEGKQIIYSRVSIIDYSNLYDVISYFSEVNMLGVIGSYILDRYDLKQDNFYFKHHYITQTLESEILYKLFDAISQKKIVTINNTSKVISKVIPLNIYFSTQSGRIYLMAYDMNNKTFKSYRIDYILKVTMNEEAVNFDELREKFEEIKKHIWGVVVKKKNKNLEHIRVEFHIEDNEQYIYDRLQREKRCGTIKKINDNTYVFNADIFDTSEIVPWLRTYICRITKIDFSNRTIENNFKKDIEKMYELYEI